MRRTLTILSFLLLVSCGEPLRLPAGTPAAGGTPLVSQSAWQTATAQAAGAAASATADGRADTAATSTASRPTELPTTSVPATSTPAPTEAPATPSPVTPTTAPATPTASAVPSTPTPAVVIVPITPTPQTSEQRWRAQQVGRQVLEPKRLYRAARPVALMWWDPATMQVLEIGLISGDFPVQASFTFRPDGREALEVPYRINTDFGLTAISDALRARMEAAGYPKSVEAFVYTEAGLEPLPAPEG